MFFKKWANPGLFFCLFSFFSITILQKNCRPQRDSNSDRWSRRRARWPLDHHHYTHLHLDKYALYEWKIRPNSLQMTNPKLLINDLILGKNVAQHHPLPSFLVTIFLMGLAKNVWTMNGSFHWQQQQRWRQQQRPLLLENTKLAHILNRLQSR